MVARICPLAPSISTVNPPLPIQFPGFPELERHVDNEECRSIELNQTSTSPISVKPGLQTLACRNRPCLQSPTSEHPNIEEVHVEQVQLMLVYKKRVVEKKKRVVEKKSKPHPEPPLSLVLTLASSSPLLQSLPVAA